MKGEFIMKDDNTRIITEATVSIDYERAYNEMRHEFNLAIELIEKYRKALLNLALNEKN